MYTFVYNQLRLFCCYLTEYFNGVSTSFVIVVLCVCTESCHGNWWTRNGILFCLFICVTGEKKGPGQIVMKSDTEINADYQHNIIVIKSSDNNGHLHDEFESLKLFVGAKPC